MAAAVVPLAPLPWLALGLLGYFPHRLELVEAYADIGRSGQHLCLAYHDDWGQEYCRAPGETRGTGWNYVHRACTAGDQRRPTWLDVHVQRVLDGAPREFVISPYLPGREWLVENVEDCDWKLGQIRTVGGEVPGTGTYDPDHYFWGAYEFGGEYQIPDLLPAPETPVIVDVAAFAAAIPRLAASPSWDQMTTAGYTWGQVAMTCMLLLYESTPLAGTPAEALLALSLWAHGAQEASAHYGTDLLDDLGLPAAPPPPDVRFLTFEAGIAGLYPRDADVPTRGASWGAVKGRFGGAGG